MHLLTAAIKIKTVAKGMDGQKKIDG